MSRRFGKKPIWLTSIAIKSLLFGMALFLGEGDFVPMIIVAAGVGLMNGCGSVIGPSLKADVVDWDEGQTGERKEGSYFAASNFVQKSAGGVAVWAIGIMLAMTGFVPNVAQSEEAINGMRALAVGAPCIMHILALLLMMRFSLDETEHSNARQRTDQHSASKV